MTNTTPPDTKVATPAAASAATPAATALPTNYRPLFWSNRISFLVAGFCIAAWAPMIPYVKERFGLDEHNLGLLLLCVGIGSFVSMPTSGYFSSKFGCRLPIYTATIVVALCLLSIPFIGNIYLLGLTLFIMGIAAVALDVISNINAALVEQVSKQNIMSGLHGLYSVGGFCGSLSVTFLLSAQFSLSTAALYAAIVLAALILLGGRNLITNVHISEAEEVGPKSQESARSTAANTTNAATTNTTTTNAATTTAKASTLQYYTNPTILLIGLMCFIMFMTEGSMLDWSGVFLTTERGFALEHAGYGYAAFAITMTICRLTGDRIVTKLGRGRVILAGTMFIIMGFVIAVIIPHYSAAFLGFALIGVGASNVVPQLVSVTARIKEVPPHISVTVVNAVGFSGMLMGPALIGFLANAITLHNTYLCQAAGVLVVTLLTLYLIKNRRELISSSHAAAAATSAAPDNADTIATTTAKE